MPGFLQVPDWPSWENQGGGVATADLGNGTQDLVVLAVDSAAGSNRGLYRIGASLDGDGRVTGGWTDWLEVPDWFAWENQGAGLALGDLDGTGTQDLVIAMIDSPDGRNQGFLRVGRSLDAEGTVAGGWGSWRSIPDWFSWENQGISIALTPPDGAGRRDLVVFMIDDAAQLNRGLYRLATGIQADGTVAAWTPWIDVPDWFSWENQGCGAAVADLQRDGGRDLVVFQIDNAVGQNQAFYRIAEDLGDDGMPVGGWGPWLGVPNWFSWENEGGSIAVAELDGQHELVAFMIDSPPQQNAGLYELLGLDPDPSREGRWELLPFHSGVLAVHAALLPHGRVLFFAGSGSSAARFKSPLFGDETEGIFMSVVWDPPGNAFSHPPTLRTAANKPFDFFCGGDAFLADGRLLSAGGTLDYGPFKGRKDAAVFDPQTEQWSFVASMAHGRWYPTLLTLGDGVILAATGLSEIGDAHNEALELYSSTDDAWETVHFAPGFPGLPLYAHLFLLEDGRVFFSGGRMDDPLNVQPCIMDISQGLVPTHPVADLLDPDTRNQSASVLLPPAQEQRVMVCGGGPVGKADKTDATDAVSIVDLRANDPRYVAAAPLGLPRLHLNAVILPDHTVFVTGGSLKQEDEPLARLQAEIYDPDNDTWRLMAAATVPRLYHSTALLLPDGRVVAAGGNPEGGTHVEWDADDMEEMRLEVFSPPYLFHGARPHIDAAPEQCNYGETITVTTAQAANVRWASLIKNGVTTHSFDSSQRLIDLDIEARDEGSLRATVTANPNIAPPGWYMLFIVDQRRIPSTATWIHLGP
jgi:hypothetical protein